MARSSERTYTLSDKELRKLQLTLLDMLLEINRICKKNEIEYILTAGTLLGAVRHGGFIPWDDDLDVSMTRDNYIKFREACITELDTNKYFFQDNTTDPYYPWGYARIRRKNSEFVRVGQEHLKMKTGIFVDIFPVDNVSNRYIVRALQGLYCMMLRKTLYAQVGSKSSKTAAHRFLYTILNCVPRSFVFGRLESIQKRWNRKDTNWVRSLTFPIPQKGEWGYPRRLFEEECEVEFENHLFPAPKDYKWYLTNKYGEYMSLPPPEKRHWHPVSKFRLPEE